MTISRLAIAATATTAAKTMTGRAIRHRVTPAASSAVTSLCRSSHESANMALASETTALVPSKNWIVRYP
jgi:hypothetical protein